MSSEKTKYKLIFAKKKFAHELNRKKIRKLVRLGLRQKSKAKYSKFEAINFLEAKLEKINKKRKMVNKSLVIEIPQSFSFFKNPDEVIEVLSTLVHNAREDDCNSYFINHSNCKTIDLGASIVMDVILMYIRSEWTRNNAGKTLSGKFPDAGHVRDVFRATGLIKTLNLKKFHLDKKEENEKFIVLNLLTGRKQESQSNTSPEKDFATVKIVDYLDKCLKTKKKQLTGAGKRKFTKLVGEVLDNVEEHNPKYRWHVIAYLNQSDESAECHVTIFNFGRSIYETLCQTGSDALKSNISKLVEEHNTKNFFFSREWEEENLWTLYALQEGVSRHFGTPEGIDRGNGTVNMIRFFQEIGKSSIEGLGPKMVLISGKTQILFDEKYQMQDRKFGEEVRKVIAFNEDNDLEQKPDKDYVKSLNYHFPGTVIDVKFFVDREYLETISKKKANGI